MIRHYRSTAICFILAMIIGLWFMGCQPVAQSLINPEELVSRTVLENEFAQLSKDINCNVDELEREFLKRIEKIENQEQIRAAVANAAKAYAATGELNPVGIITLLSAILGIGAIADNRKKDGIIKALKSTNGTGAATTN